jgi:hypothetical protein
MYIFNILTKYAPMRIYVYFGAEILVIYADIQIALE